MNVESYSWSVEKNERLKAERNVSFEDVVFHVIGGHVLDVIAHPNPARYPEQQVLIVQMREYAWLVPFVQEGKEAFLKTIIPSRKATKMYLGDNMPNFNLDPEEQELLHSYENEAWQSVPNLAEEIKRHQQYAAATIQQKHLVGFALPPEDFDSLRKRAEESGVTYQALLAALVHKYIAGELVEQRAVPA